LAEAIIKLLRDSQLREKMGLRAKELIAGNFSFQLMLKKFNALYDSFYKINLFIRKE